MKPDVSIIIPAYNCESTLEEAVESCFDQGLPSFEIVIVNDCSADGTERLIEKLAATHPGIRHFSNSRNLGGGATRNRAARESLADIVFCLDSDDILPQGTLSLMLSCMQENGCDAVGIHESIKFAGQDRGQVRRIDTFGYADEKIPFDALFERNGVLCPLYSTFMFTKKAFEIAGGYPENHGFDTQGFAWRFLSNGLTAYGCRGATYLHRIENGESYYMREYNSGKINLNWFLILEEYLFLFDEDTQRFLLDYDLGNTRRNPFDAIRDRHIGMHEDLIMQNSRDSYSEHLGRTGTKNPIDQYWLGSFLAGKGEFRDAIEILGSIRHDRLIQKAARRKLRTVRAKMRFGDRQDRIRKAEMAAYGARSRNSPVSLARRIRSKLAHKLSVYAGPFRDRNWNPLLAFSLLSLQMRKALKAGFGAKGDSEAIDIVIPTLGQDLELLGASLGSISLIGNPVNKVYVVAPPRQELADFCAQRSCILVDEKDVLPYSKDRIGYVVEGKDRNGWLFQQLLKLNADSFVEKKQYLVLDSDTVIISPISFIQDSKFILQEGTEWNADYYSMFERMFGYGPRNRLSFVCHMMLFDRGMLAEMKSEIEKFHGKRWDDVIISQIDRRAHSGFSEFETYGNWMSMRHRDRIRKIPFYNKSIPRDRLQDLKVLSERYGKSHTSLSFHHYI